MPTYQESILKMYNDRPFYDTEAGTQHPRVAEKLVAAAAVMPGNTVLDLATGTGLVAFAAADRIGITGHVEAIDISEGLLEQARRKQAAAQVTNVDFRLADAERTLFPQEHYDRIFCCEALVLFENPIAAIHKWQRLLRPGGSIAFTCTYQDSYFGEVLQSAITAVLGPDAPRQMHEALGTEEKIHTHLSAAGFREIEITSEKQGSYKAPASIRCGRDFVTVFFKGAALAMDMTEDQLNQVCELFTKGVREAATPKGVWQSTGLFFVHGHRT